ncbi:hypothetical protein CRE_17834 [Caenorhabditis remanei]|uniref:Uncharacterized protein n=1 Tax=Caenorhabditis remanei TaxID=31234 RepID=E3MDK9_CAERE|nr:hypothetical protein CRE_17834 [Caenorhabditis remanei]
MGAKKSKVARLKEGSIDDLTTALTRIAKAEHDEKLRIELEHQQRIDEERQRMHHLREQEKEKCLEEIRRKVADLEAQKNKNREDQEKLKQKLLKEGKQKISEAESELNKKTQEKMRECAQEMAKLEQDVILQNAEREKIKTLIKEASKANLKLELESKEKQEEMRKRHQEKIQKSDQAVQEFQIEILKEIEVMNRRQAEISMQKLEKMKSVEGQHLKLGAVLLLAMTENNKSEHLKKSRDQLITNFKSFKRNVFHNEEKAIEITMKEMKNKEKLTSPPQLDFIKRSWLHFSCLLSDFNVPNGSELEVPLQEAKDARDTMQKAIDALYADINLYQKKFEIQENALPANNSNPVDDFALPCFLIAESSLDIMRNTLTEMHDGISKFQIEPIDYVGAQLQRNSLGNADTLAIAAPPIWSGESTVNMT